LTFDTPPPPAGGSSRLNHPKCHTRPKTTRVFWDRKREENMARDKRVTRQLRREGWKVIRIWQHSLQKSPASRLTRLHRALTT
jgi:DNA mismatch endonuclease, patch repair protein